MNTKCPIPNRSHRRKGTENTLCRITYTEIARLSGLTTSTVKMYAWNHKFDPYDLGSVLRFIVSYRAKRGLSPIGTTT